MNRKPIYGRCKKPKKGGNISKLTAQDKKDLKTLGKLARSGRESDKMMLYDIADREHFSVYQHWQKIESGITNINFTTLLKVCRTLKKQPSEFLKDFKIKF